MTTGFLARVLLALAVISTPVLGQAADEPTATDFAKEQKQKWNEFYRKEAASYVIVIDGDPAKPLSLYKESVLHWSNPVRFGDTNGTVFVWTRDEPNCEVANSLDESFSLLLDRRLNPPPK